MGDTDWTMIHAASIVNDCWLLFDAFWKKKILLFWTYIFIGDTIRALLEHELMKNENENNNIRIVNCKYTRRADESRWNNKHGNDDEKKMREKKKNNI